MSATYRIDIERDDTLAIYNIGPYRAAIVRLSDDMTQQYTYGESPERALEMARTWVKAKAHADERFSVYVDDEGEWRAAQRDRRVLGEGS